MKLSLCLLLTIQLVPSTFSFEVHGTSSGRTATTSLFGLKRQRRGLVEVNDVGVVSSPKKVKKSKVTLNKSESADISPALAEWAASSATRGGDDASTSLDQDDRSTTVTEFVAFEDKNKGRRSKQSDRVEQDKRKSVAVQQILDDLEEVLGQKGKGSDNILEQIQKLISLPSANLRVMTAGKEQHIYRLAWVGSDDAICHIGTGLHKVPLARLQEIFLTCQGKNRIEIFEVISILGPFPNVRNTLQGASEVTVGDVTDWTLVMDSMIDGTGKEILAGKEENIRRVALQIYFADPNAIVAVVPPKNGVIRESPLEDNGSNVLLFTREVDLDNKLEALRVL